MPLVLNQGEPVVRANPKSCYVLYVGLMHGDADAYSTIQLGPYDSATLSMRDRPDDLGLEAALRVVEAARRLNETNWNEATELYGKIPNWETIMDDPWEADSTYNDNLAMYDSHHIRYFDEYGSEFKVTYQLEDSHEG